MVRAQSELGQQGASLRDLQAAALQKGVEQGLGWRGEARAGLVELADQDAWTDPSAAVLQWLVTE